MTSRVVTGLAFVVALGACSKSVPASMRVDMKTIRSMVADLRTSRGVPCLSVDQLVAEKYLSQGTHDAWGTQFVVECTAAKVVVRSAGPDRALNTSDDLLEQ